VNIFFAQNTSGFVRSEITREHMFTMRYSLVAFVSIRYDLINYELLRYTACPNILRTLHFIKISILYG